MGSTQETSSLAEGARVRFKRGRKWHKGFVRSVRADGVFVTEYDRRACFVALSDVEVIDKEVRDDAAK